MSKEKKESWGNLTSTKPSLEEVAKHFKGLGGGPEGESHVIDANSDKKEGFVYVYSTKADAAKIIDRCGDAIVDYVQLKIDRKAFRGIHCAFRNVK